MEATQWPFTDASKSLSDPDLSCIGLAEEYGGTVITNDKQMTKTTENRDTHWCWGTAFLIRTFERCDISQREFEEQKHEYVDDLHLNDRVEEQLLRAQKPDSS